MTYTLSMFNTGQITLPKKWRSRQSTNKFIAEETDQWLLIKPIKFSSKDDFSSFTDENITLTEDSISFEKPVNAKLLAELLKKNHG